MKKIILGVCGILVFLGGLAGLRSGALKAGELAEDSSLIVETGTSESAVTIPESSAVPEIPENPENLPVSEAEVEATPEGESSEPPIVSSEVPATSATTPPPTESSTTVSSSSTASSVTSSSTSDSTATSQTSSVESSSSVSTEPSTTTPSSTTPSVTVPSSSEPSKVPSSPAPTQPSTNPSVSTPAAPAPEPVVPSTPAAAATAAPSTASVQATSFVAPSAPAAFDPTSTVQLPDELRTTTVTPSDLKGFELPLLTHLKEATHGALIYEGIRKVGTEQEEDYGTQQLADELYRELFDLAITGKPEKLQEEPVIGSLIYQKKKNKEVLLGIAIGDDYYLSVDTVNVEEEEASQRQVVIDTVDAEEELLVLALPTTASLTDYGKKVLAEYPASMKFTENDSAKAFIEKVGEDARELGQEYDVFASVMIAQALIESGSGTSSLSLSPNHNLFGIKGSYQGQSVSMATQEDRGNGALYSIQSAFRKYPNYAASLGDYVQLLRGGISGNDTYYQQTWRSQAKNYLRTAQALTGTYATDTTYGKKLSSIIALYHLTQYDQPKIEGDSGLFIEKKQDIPADFKSHMKYPEFNGVNYNRSGSYPVGQCTWYAFNRVKQFGKSVDDYMGNGGQWATKGKALGYEVSRKPKAGWLISFKPGVAGSDPRYGHVAFVEAVRPEGILISEGNVYGGTVISYRVIDTALATSDQVAYVKAK